MRENTASLQETPEGVFFTWAWIPPDVPLDDLLQLGWPFDWAVKMIM